MSFSSRDNGWQFHLSRVIPCPCVESSMWRVCRFQFCSRATICKISSSWDRQTPSDPTAAPSHHIHLHPFLRSVHVPWEPCCPVSILTSPSSWGTRTTHLLHLLLSLKPRSVSIQCSLPLWADLQMMFPHPDVAKLPVSGNVLSNNKWPCSFHFWGR